MSKKDKEIFDSYASGNPNQRFDLIYKNYHTFPKLIDSFETGVFNMILNEREYNRRAKNKADLGVRVLQELLQHLLDRISSKGKKLKLLDKFE